jgi:release factor glutamine methyltransferase
MFDTNFARIGVFENVYEPSDDTWLLIEIIRRNKEHYLCLDLGSGTGIIGIYLLKNNICQRVVFIDVNEYALLNTQYNLYLNRLLGNGVVMSTNNYNSLVNNYFELVTANPPYLPGESRDIYDEALISGPRGYEKVLYFINFAYNVLRCNGYLYLVYSSLSNPKIVEGYLSRFFIIRRKVSRHFFFEDIIGVEAVKKCL